jgi:hypothetical protein
MPEDVGNLLETASLRTRGCGKRLYEMLPMARF